MTKSLARLVACCAALTATGLFAAPFAAKAATYYVDANAGSDANAGTSRGAPWQHCPGMAAYSGPENSGLPKTISIDQNMQINQE